MSHALGFTRDEGGNDHLAIGGPEVVEAAEHEVDRRGVCAEDCHAEQDRPVPRLGVRFN